MGGKHSKRQPRVSVIPKQNFKYNRPHDYFSPQSTICNVKFKEKSGTGAIYGYMFPEETWRTLFITSNQVLRISNIREVTDLRLVYTDKIIGNVDITPDWVKWLWTSPRNQLNVTIIEFSPTALKILARTKYARLISANPEQNMNVTIHNYNGDIITGSIINVSGDVVRFKSEVEEISAGAPLLNENLDVIGIYAGRGKQVSHQFEAINIISIIEAYTNYLIKASGAKTDSELWLEKFSTIPNNEYDPIGSGGYGQVYKVKINIELAVKIVRGFGQLSDQEPQVRALEKEFGIVSSLDNHPRIIKFFAFVKDPINTRIMIIMEYLEGGSLAGKLKDQKPLSNFIVHKYLMQILEGVDFLHLHRRNIYHSDLKPANFLLTAEDNLKICDFGIAVGSQWQTQSSATSSHIKGDLYYMSPERINNASRSALNDIWSVGATYVEMLTGQPLNHMDSMPQFIINILQYNIFLNGIGFDEFIQTLTIDSLAKEIITKTLCPDANRANSSELLSILEFKFLRRIPKQSLRKPGEKAPRIFGMSFDSARDELLLADFDNRVVRAMRLRDNRSALKDVYRTSVYSVCHMSDSDTLLVCSQEQNKSWLVALSRSGSEWSESHRMQTEGIPLISCALSDSQLLIGQCNSQYMELFKVESGPRIAYVRRIQITEEYDWFSATCGIDTLVAMSYQNKNEVRVHQLCGYRLEKLTSIHMQTPYLLLWLSDRLLVTELHADKEVHSVAELEIRGTAFERCRHIIVPDDSIRVSMWCAVGDGLAIYDLNSKNIVHYSFLS